MRKWWRGPDGVRAGWCVLLFVLLNVLLVFACVYLTPRAWLLSMITKSQITPGFMAYNEMVLLIPAVAATAIMTRFEGRKFLSCGLGGGRALARFTNGVFWGLFLLAAIMLVLVATGHAALAWGGLGGRGVVFYALAWAIASLLTGLAEELALRGYLLQTITRGLGFWPALVITSLVFGALHISNHGEGIVGVASAALGGAIMALGVRGMGSLWWSIGLHSAWDYAENFIFGTPDSGQICVGALLHTTPLGSGLLSGGATGPEGSLFTLALLAAAFVLAWRVFGRPLMNK
jgi:membrane protease YdiL (CAAX protease family)